MSIFAVNGKAPVTVWCPSLDTAGNGTTTLTDLVGSNDGTLTNMTPASDWVLDDGNYALDFDGFDDYVIADRIGFGDGSPWSVTFWVKLHVVTDFATFFVEALPATPPVASASVVQCDYQLATNRFRLVVFNAGDAQILLADTFGAASLNQWHFVSIGYNTTHIYIAINGHPRNTATATVGNDAVTRSVTLGAQLFRPNGVRYLNGRIDDVRIWQSQVIMPADEASLFAAGRAAINVGLRRRRRHPGVPT